jgi:hypothetical protein
LRSELERFGGTVEKFIGDAVMALFGAPVAHEDDPGRAVLAALAIRDRERGVLRDALARVRAERSVQLVTVVGVPGIGKSRLLSELWQTAEAEGEPINWRLGRSLPYGEGVTFWALAEMVKAQAGILETDTAGQAEAKLAAMTVEVVPGAAEASWVGRHLGALVGLGGGGAPFGGDRQGEAFAAWRYFFEALAESRPLVLVFEDLHWANEGLLDFVDYLADWAGGVPLLVVGSARPELLERRPGWGGGKPNALTFLAESAALPHYQDTWIRCYRAWIRLARGDTEAALQDQREALISGRQAKDPQILFEALAVSAYMLALLGRADEAQPILAELFGTGAFDLGGLDEASMDCVLAAEILGHRDQAGRWLSNRRDSPWYVAARALIDQEFVAAAEVLDSMGAARSAAQVRLRAGQELARTGRRAEADDQLRRALSFFRSVDATRFIREAEALLAASA